MLVNSHPAFGCGAYAAGCVNEPPPESRPSLELRRIRIAPADGPQFAEFAEEFPEVLRAHVFYVALRASYDLGAELTASYGPR